MSRSIVNENSKYEQRFLSQWGEYKQKKITTRFAEISSAHQVIFVNLHKEINSKLNKKKVKVISSNLNFEEISKVSR